MAKIKIEDLPKDLKISKEELKRIRGGLYSSTFVGSISFKSLQFAVLESGELRLR